MSSDKALRDKRAIECCLVGALIAQACGVPVPGHRRAILKLLEDHANPTSEGGYLDPNALSIYDLDGETMKTEVQKIFNAGDRDGDGVSHCSTSLCPAQDNSVLYTQLISQGNVVCSLTMRNAQVAALINLFVCLIPPHPLSFSTPRSSRRCFELPGLSWMLRTCAKSLQRSMRTTTA